MNAPALAIVGPTASGKSALALEFARQHGDVELVSADAMQVYRGMDIGTAKPSSAERDEVPHHLIDVADPSEDFSLARYLRLAADVIDVVAERQHRALVVGGTGLYVRGVVDRLDVPGQFPDVRIELDAEPDTAALHARLAGLDPLAASRMEPGNRRRVVRALEVTLGAGRPFSSFGPGLTAYPEVPTVQFGLDLPLAELDRRIEERVHSFVAAGFVAEVVALRNGPPLSRTAAQALGYRELLAHLRGERSLDEAVAETVTRTRRFARRQRRWFRRDPRVVWLDGRLSTDELVRSMTIQ